MNQAEPDYRTVLVTRPAHQAEGLMTALRLRGYTPIAAPVLEMRATDAAIPAGDFDALVFTSANGVNAFAARSDKRDIPVFAVGASTAAAARKAHFEWIMTGNQGAVALTEVMRARLAAGSRVLHPAGRDVAVDLAEALAGSGITVERVALYAMDRAASLPEAAIAAIRGGCVAPLLSRRSAEALFQLAADAGVSLARVLAILPLQTDFAGAGFEGLVFAPIHNGDDAVIEALNRLEAVKRHL